jgi:hypothetical protein
MLSDAGIRLSVVVSDIHGVSARSMVKAHLEKLITPDLSTNHRKAIAAADVV